MAVVRKVWSACEITDVDTGKRAAGRCGGRHCAASLSTKTTFGKVDQGVCFCAKSAGGGKEENCVTGPGGGGQGMRGWTMAKEEKPRESGTKEGVEGEAARGSNSDVAAEKTSVMESSRSPPSAAHLPWQVNSPSPPQQQNGKEFCCPSSCWRVETAPEETLKNASTSPGSCATRNKSHPPRRTRNKPRTH